jgi:hypothetical protein
MRSTAGEAAPTLRSDRRRSPLQDAEHAERQDKAVDAQTIVEKAVDRADGEADGEREQDCGDRRLRPALHEAAARHHDQPHELADRQVDHPAGNDESLADREDRQRRGLLHDLPEIEHVAIFGEPKGRNQQKRDEDEVDAEALRELAEPHEFDTRCKKAGAHLRRRGKSRQPLRGRGRGEAVKRRWPHCADRSGCYVSNWLLSGRAPRLSRRRGFRTPASAARKFHDQMKMPRCARF